MESIRRPVPALAPRPFWFLVALAAGVALLLAAPPSPAQQTEPPPPRHDCNFHDRLERRQDQCDGER